MELRDRFLIRNIRIEEWVQTAEIERICFPPNEACSPEHMKERVEMAHENFLVAEDRETGKIAGFLNGLGTDEDTLRDEFYTDASLHNPNGKNVLLTGLSVLPQYRGLGLARELVRTYVEREKKRGGHRLILTCLPEKVVMYQKFGFEDFGVSGSQWGGEKWHEMVYVIQNA